MNRAVSNVLRLCILQTEGMKSCIIDVLPHATCKDDVNLQVHDNQHAQEHQENLERESRVGLRGSKYLENLLF